MPLINDVHNYSRLRTSASQCGAVLIAKKMDIAGVRRAVAFPFTEDNLTNQASKELFEDYLEQIVPYCAVNPRQPDAVDEVCRRVKEWECKGCKPRPSSNGFPLSDPDLASPLFEHPAVDDLLMGGTPAEIIRLER